MNSLEFLEALKEGLPGCDVNDMNSSGEIYAICKQRTSQTDITERAVRQLVQKYLGHIVIDSSDIAKTSGTCVSKGDLLTILHDSGHYISLANENTCCDEGMLQAGLNILYRGNRRPTEEETRTYIWLFREYFGVEE